MSQLDNLGIKYGTDKSSLGHDYLRHYESVLQGIRSAEFTFIEIGGLNGASLNMWRDYFAKAKIVCLDVNPNVSRFSGNRILVEIGDCGSIGFLKSVKEKYKSAQIILDDGSHRWDHQRIAFRELFPIVSPGGFYIVEDVHTSFESGFSGNDDFPFIEYLKTLADYLHQRGEQKKQFEGRFNKSLIAMACQVDWILFVPRSCIIKKKMSASK